MRRQTEKKEAATVGLGSSQFPHPDCLPVHFEQGLEFRGTERVEPADIYLDADRAIIKRVVADLPVDVVIPVHLFDGIMVRITPGEMPGEVKATLILKHSDEALSITLIETEKSDNLATLWSRWARALDLPMLVCDLSGRVKPIEAYSAVPSATPAPRRKLRLLTGRRPRFLNRRRPGKPLASTRVFANEREIIARS